MGLAFFGLRVDANGAQLRVSRCNSKVCAGICTSQRATCSPQALIVLFAVVATDSLSRQVLPTACALAWILKKSASHATANWRYFLGANCVVRQFCRVARAHDKFERPGVSLFLRGDVFSAMSTQTVLIWRGRLWHTSDWRL